MSRTFVIQENVWKLAELSEPITVNGVELTNGQVFCPISDENILFMIAGWFIQQDNIRNITSI